MALLDRIRLRTGSDLPDSEIQAMVDTIRDDMDARFGPGGLTTVELGDPADPASRTMRTLRLARPMDVGAAVTIVELDPGNSGDPGAEVTLASGDYAVLHAGRTLQRRTGGPNGRTYWAPLVRVTYVPIGEEAAREEAIIKIIFLDLSYRGALKSERAGDYQVTLSGDPVADREAIFTALANRRGMVMA